MEKVKELSLEKWGERYLDVLMECFRLSK